ncbi:MULTISPECIES: zinc ABC transporter ATP-binding protein AztA [unclassified Micromonospora]|uniref:zinc ABC transporter ATP-binding protein AztA n=1 Tax=unclassified Micromonospora TaxID=2617518 RepID=UPI0022B66B2B|nr:MULTISPECIES: zinc ABC transporter ATP-binding protein AztA [unclassified Micromonospora]MCZ7418689.1 zinc ABC transporter ATP-binding protein AztA [Verrucosispora sp. WMMA2121]WBB92391.1 zinc ABC transporter ATP-binding protein AztA [Verrucosispora sp. WMMC514]
MGAEVLTVEHVAFRYAGIPVLRDVNLRVEAAATVAVTGANGSGKSTLLHLLAGVEEPAEGSVRRRAGCRLALLPQRTSGIDALPLTVAECVQIGRFRPRRRLNRDDRAAVSTIMERLDLVHLARRRLRELSGGQRQRTLIAQALVQVADIYVLDEPTVALDATSRQRVHDLLAERVRAGAAVVYASHDAADAALADRTVRLAGAVECTITDTPV